MTTPIAAGLVDADVRARFERWITAPPFEKTIERHGENGSWPGNYRDYGVQLAWCAWKDSAKAELDACRTTVRDVMVTDHGLPTMATRAQDMWDALHAAYSIGRCEEREACAKVCDANAEHWRGMYTTANPRATELVLRGYSAREDSAADCATNIRQRSNALANAPASAGD